MRLFLLASLVLVLLSLSIASLAAEWQELELGYYNIADFEALVGSPIESFHEAPMLAELVAAGELPPVAERLPNDPLVQIPWESIGEYGGTIRYSEFTIDHDHYTRHFLDTHLLNLQPNDAFHWRSGPYLGVTQPGIFSDWSTSDDARVFEFTIRDGLRWSDGVLVTTADVEYYVHDVLLNADVTPVMPRWLRWGSPTNENVTTVEILDDRAFQVIFENPYPAFLYSMIRTAYTTWPNLFRPKHFVSQFHRDYVEIEELLPLMREMGYDSEDDWGTFYGDYVGQAPTDGGIINLGERAIGYPTLAPYVTVSVRETGDWAFERNPYFYMVDPAGNQLPYIDRVQRRYIAESEMVNMDIIAGNTDFQTQFIRIDDYPLYNRNEDAGNYYVMPVKAWQHHLLIYIMNYVPQDEKLRALTEDVRFRQALSMGLDREQIKETIFMGFGEASQFAPPKDSEYYEEGMGEAYAEYDPQAAMALLDEIGLVDTTGDGYRNYADGSVFRLPLEFYVVTPAAIPGVELAERYWQDIGVQVDAREVQGSYFWMLHGTNEHVATVWWADGPQLLDPHFLGFNVHTPQWRTWHLTNGADGIEPPEWAKQLLRAQDTVESSADADERLEAGKTIWRLQQENLPVIGTVVDPRTPFVYSKDLGNVGIAGEFDFFNTMILDGFTQWYFASEARR